MPSHKSAIHKFFVILGLLTVSVLVFNQGAFALSAEQRGLFNLGVYQFDVSTGAAAPSCSTSPTELSGNGRIAEAYNFLIGEGFTDYQAAGIIGNLYAESGVMPNRKQGDGIQTIQSFSEVTPGTGYGLAQWTEADRQVAWSKFAQAQKMDELSLLLQLKFLMSELKAKPGATGLGYEQLVDAGDLRQAAWIFLSFYERPRVVLDAGKGTDPVQPTSGPAFDELNLRVEYADKANGDGGSPITTTSASPACAGSQADGQAVSANGYTFPLITTKAAINGASPARWNPDCRGDGCHHNYLAADIFEDPGTQVVAMRGGKVTSAKDVATSPSGIGTRISIVSDDGFMYYYAHMGPNTLAVREGQQVEAGTVLGKLGESVNAAGTQPHLHIDRLPSNQHQTRPPCSGAGCKSYPFDDIKLVLSEVFKSLK